MNRAPQGASVDKVLDGARGSPEIHAYIQVLAKEIRYLLCNTPGKEFWHCTTINVSLRTQAGAVLAFLRRMRHFQQAPTAFKTLESF